MEKRNTIQRQLVLQAVRALQCHPTAEQVYDVVSSQHPTVSKATVYRNLNSLVEDGELVRLSMPCDADRFDDHLNFHYHLHCEICSQVVDLPLCYLDTLNKSAEKGSGCKVKSHNLMFTGRCKDCAKST
ncbi:MAG: transcriptional repressor [Pygmaiobacter sp.]